MSLSFLLSYELLSVCPAPYIESGTWYLLKITCWGLEKKKNIWVKELNEGMHCNDYHHFEFLKLEGDLSFPQLGKHKENLWMTLWGGLAVGEQVFLSPLGPHPRLKSYLESPWRSGWAAAFFWRHFLGKRFQCLDFIS